MEKPFCDLVDVRFGGFGFWVVVSFCWGQRNDRLIKSNAGAF